MTGLEERFADFQSFVAWKDRDRYKPIVLRSFFANIHRDELEVFKLTAGRNFFLHEIMRIAVANGGSIIRARIKTLVLT